MLIMRYINSPYIRACHTLPSATLLSDIFRNVSSSVVRSNKYFLLFQLLAGPGQMEMRHLKSVGQICPIQHIESGWKHMESAPYID